MVCFVLPDCFPFLAGAGIKPALTSSLPNWQQTISLLIFGWQEIADLERHVGKSERRDRIGTPKSQRVEIAVFAGIAIDEKLIMGQILNPDFRNACRRVTGNFDIAII